MSLRPLEQNIKDKYDTKREQVDASVRFVLHDNADYYEALNNTPARVQAAVLKYVVDSPRPAGYHFNVLRAALQQYHRGTGLLRDTELPFTSEELEEW